MPGSVPCSKDTIVKENCVLIEWTVCLVCIRYICHYLNTLQGPTNVLKCINKNQKLSYEGNAGKGSVLLI